MRAEIDNARPNNQDSPSAKRQRELRAQLNEIRQKQRGFKDSRTSTQEKINAIDATVKARIAEQNNLRSRLPFKNVEELDREVARLEKQVDSGTLRLVDEKKALSEVSNLRKQRKNFGSIDDLQKVIGNLKTQITELKKALDNPESRALSDKYHKIQKELDAIKAEQDVASRNLNALRDERTRLSDEQQKKFAAVRDVKNIHNKARRAYKEYEEEAWRQRRERQKALREATEFDKKKKAADRKLEEASQLAYADEIFHGQALIRHFEPSYDFSALGLDEKKNDPSDFRAQVGRTVDDSNIKGVKVVKKEDRDDDYFVGTGGKKGKKGKKGAAAAPGEGKFNLSFGVIEDFARLRIDPPMNQSDVPAVVEKLAAKIAEWKKNQSSKTEEVSDSLAYLTFAGRLTWSEQNINKVKEEIARLDAQASKASTSANGESKKTNGVNGSSTPATETTEKEEETHSEAGAEAKTEA